MNIKASLVNGCLQVLKIQRKHVLLNFLKFLTMFFTTRQSEQHNAAKNVSHITNNEHVMLITY